MPEIIKVKNLSKSFGKQEVIKNLSFSIKAGEVFAILGKNGAGKTTLIKMLLNILLADSGNIFYNDKPLADYRQSLYRDFSAVLENAENTYGYLSAIQNIFYFAALHQRKITKQEVMSLLTQFDLQGVGNKRVSKFSRGMKQKLSIIVSMLSDSKVLFLDEPTLGLDFKANKELLQLVKKLSVKFNKTIVLTSHQAEVIDSLADTVLLLDAGQIAYLGDYESFISKYSLKHFEIDSEAGSFTFDTQAAAEEKLSLLIRKEIRIIRYGEVAKSIDDILIDFYEGASHV